jgi:hypothetical protein
MATLALDIPSKAMVMLSGMTLLLKGPVIWKNERINTGHHSYLTYTVNTLPRKLLKVLVISK